MIKVKTGGVAGDQLRSIIDRLERLETERQGLGEDIRGVFAEAASNGFDQKAIRAILKLRKKDEAERDEEAAILDLYMRAIGLLPELDS